jgi:DNA-binding NarL/FixJ family response regulator
MNFVQGIITTSSSSWDGTKSIKLPFTKDILHRLSKCMHNNNFNIEERRRQVASMLAQSMTETEIAEQLDVDQSTISRDVKVLKKKCHNNFFDLAKSDLAYYYKQ